MPNDVVSKPSIQSPILDRFHLLLNERQNEIRFPGDDYDGGVLPALTTEDFVRVYQDVLSELTINSKPIITDLTIIAGDYREHAHGIAHSICARILEVPVEQKLPSLYLLDSIVKNIGRDYVRHFASDLPEVFCEVYRQVPPNMHSSMRHLFGTWSTVFPSWVLRQIEDELQLSSPMNQPTSSLANLRASGSPRPSHGIHVNPEYLKARHQFDNVSAKNNIKPGRRVPNLKTLSQKDSVGFEDNEFDQAENLDAQKFYTSGIGGHKSFLPSANKLSPSVSGSGRPLSPSVDNFAVSSSPGRIFERDSPSNYARVRGRDEEIADWQKRHRSGDFNHGRENVASFSLRNGFDHDRPRALIDAYGHDDGQGSLNRKPIGLDSQILNGIASKNSWQNTEEEEFDWEDMSPTLADGKANNFTKSSIPSTTDVRGRPPVNSINHSSMNSWGNSSQMLRAENPQNAIVDANQIRDGAVNLPGMLTAPLPKLPAAGREHTSQLNINGAPHAGNLFTPDQFSFSTRPPSPQGPPVPTDLRPPTSLHSVMPLPPLYPQQKHPRPSFEYMNSTFTVLNQGPRQFENDENRSSFSLNPAQRPQPGFTPLHHQRPHVSLPQQLPIALPRPANLGYPQQGQMGSASNVGNNPIHSFHHPPFQNASNSSVQFRGPVLPFPPGPRPYSLIPPHPQSTGAAVNQPGSVNISGLLNSLVAQGLLPSMKQPSDQDSVGVEFDPDLLKVRHESAIRALYGDLPRQCTTCGLRFKTQDEHSKHMDWHVTKNRISKNRKHNPSRKWFVSSSMWLSGAESLGIDATPGFLPAETVIEKKDDEEMAVPADEDQTACALCGEPFEDFYSDETEEWMYRGAVYSNTPCSGTTFGMDRSQLGPIVHAKCRSESTTAPS